MRPGRAADHSPRSSAAVMEEYSYISTHPLDHTGPVTGSHVEYRKESHQETHRSRGSKLVFGFCLTADTVKCGLLATED